MSSRPKSFSHMILASKLLLVSKRASGAEGQLPARRGTQDGLKLSHLYAMSLEASGLSAMRLEFHAPRLVHPFHRDGRCESFGL